MAGRPGRVGVYTDRPDSCIHVYVPATMQLGRAPADLVTRVSVRARAEGVSRAKFIERALEAALGNREAAAPDRTREAASASAPASPRTSYRVKEPVEETPLPKIAKRHWAQ